MFATLHSWHHETWSVNIAARYVRWDPKHDSAAKSKHTTTWLHI